MAQIDVRRQYADGDILLGSDLDAFLDDLEAFLNVTKINDDNIQNNGITASDKLADASISAAKIASSAVTTAKIADSAVTTVKIADSNVTTAKIADSNVTTAKIADSNVTTAKIADSNVTTAKIADSNVTTAKIADSAVTNAKIDRVAAGKIQTFPLILMGETRNHNGAGTFTFTPTLTGGTASGALNQRYGVSQIKTGDLLLVYSANFTASIQSVTLKIVLVDSGGSQLGNAYTIGTGLSGSVNLNNNASSNGLWDVGTISGTPAYLAYEITQPGAGNNTFVVEALVWCFPQ